MPTISVITPTCDRPVGIALLERWMARQTQAPDEWIIADGGRQIASLALGGNQTFKRHFLDGSVPPGVANFHANLERGIRAATGDLIIIMEDDDWYADTHIEVMLDKLTQPGITIAGDDQQRYYNLEHRCWRLMQNRGAALAQTGFHRALIPTFLDVIAGRRAQVASADPIQRQRAIGVDAFLWQSQPREAWYLERTETVVGIKGLPGQAGLGMGHRPRVAQWTPDRDGTQLAAWVGVDDAAWYRALQLHARAAHGHLP